MKTLTIEITLKSSTLTGSGEGFGAIIDTDIVFDEIGLPYIPAKRIKGCLRDSATEVSEMFNSSGINFPLDIDNTFGKEGQEKSCPVYFSNLTIEDYQANKAWLQYYKKSNLLSEESIINFFTEIRQQTAINEDTGVAKDHSLRTIRVIKKGHKFTGEIQVEDTSIIDTLSLACLNMRHIGTKRNRGFGEIECNLYEGSSKISVLERLETICTK